LFLESARELAQRAIKSGEDDRGRVSYVFRRTVAREPTEEDMADLGKMLSKAREYYGGNNDAAAKVAGKGFENVEIADAAAWVLLARTVLNVDEVITRE
jgi:hypothetical protein